MYLFKELEVNTKRKARELYLSKKQTGGGSSSKTKELADLEEIV